MVLKTKNEILFYQECGEWKMCDLQKRGTLDKYKIKHKIRHSYLDKVDDDRIILFNDFFENWSTDIILDFWRIIVGTDKIIIVNGALCSGKSTLIRIMLNMLKLSEYDFLSMKDAERGVEDNIIYVISSDNLNNLNWDELYNSKADKIIIETDQIVDQSKFIGLNVKIITLEKPLANPDSRLTTKILENKSLFTYMINILMGYVYEETCEDKINTITAIEI